MVNRRCPARYSLLQQAAAKHHLLGFHGINGVRPELAVRRADTGYRTPTRDNGTPARSGMTIAWYVLLRATRLRHPLYLHKCG